MSLSLDQIYQLSEDVVAREIEGELIIVPLAAGMGDADDELYTLNETGRVIWSKLDGQRSLADVVRELAQEYDASESEIAADVCGLVAELVRRKMLVAAS
ncbi:MAG TPA: PqqD family protein [Anaerolineaceae bacterium]